MMATFFPSDPHDWVRTEAERRDHERAEAERKKKEKRDNFRFALTTVLSGIAALAAVAGVIIQLVSAQ